MGFSTNQPLIRWIKQNEVENNFSSKFKHYTIHDLIQEENYVGLTDYPVDRPSRLVQIECRKPGCRCVLKSEHALALKIVPGVTLVEGQWLLSCESRQNDSNQFRSGIQHESNSKLNSIVLTSCCPSWFELVYHTNSSLMENKLQTSPEVPIWFSCKAVWREKPQFILLRNEVQCLFEVRQSCTISINSFDDDSLNENSKSVINLDSRYMGVLRPGMVLHLIDCRICTLVNQCEVLKTKSCPKPVQMLQCAVVGGKTLSAIASVVTNLSSQDVLNWFDQGPRLVYIPLSSKSIICSPVSHLSTTHFVNTSQVNLNLNGTISSNSQLCDNGVHNILSLLSTYKLPVITRPVTGLHTNEWFFMGKLTKNPHHCIQSNQDRSIIQNQPLLQLHACHYGDLIFLEPISDCTSTTNTHECCSIGSKTTNKHLMINKDLNIHNTNSRFFVVTTDMLANHQFLVADSESCDVYQRHLVTHAFRVSHFLAACHPAPGLTYLLKHLEDISHSSNNGPSHSPLTRTLGPIAYNFGAIAIETAVNSVAAIAALIKNKGNDDDNKTNSNVSNEDWLSNEFKTNTICLNNLTQNNMNNMNGRRKLTNNLLESDTLEMNALCDEIEDIYYYIRNGHFPAQSQSLTSLANFSYDQTKSTTNDQSRFNQQPVSNNLDVVKAINLKSSTPVSFPPRDSVGHKQFANGTFIHIHQTSANMDNSHRNLIFDSQNNSVLMNPMVKSVQDFNLNFPNQKGLSRTGVLNKSFTSQNLSSFHRDHTICTLSNQMASNIHENQLTNYQSKLSIPDINTINSFQRNVKLTVPFNQTMNSNWNCAPINKSASPTLIDYSNPINQSCFMTTSINLTVHNHSKQTNGIISSNQSKFLNILPNKKIINRSMEFANTKMCNLLNSNLNSHCIVDTDLSKSNCLLNENSFNVDKFYSKNWNRTNDQCCNKSDYDLNKIQFNPNPNNNYPNEILFRPSVSPSYIYQDPTIVRNSNGNTKDRFSAFGLAKFFVTNRFGLNKKQVY